jgi:hypothetical protein
VESARHLVSQHVRHPVPLEIRAVSRQTNKRMPIGISRCLKTSYKQRFAVAAYLAFIVSGNYGADTV